MKTFATQTRVYMESQAFYRLQTLPIQRALIVCDPFLVQNGMTRLVTEQLDARAAAWTLFDEIVPDPTIELVAAGVKTAIETTPDTVIAMGGGSAIDTAKAIGYIYTQSTGNPRPLCVVIPTTSGTGSEATSFAVISDRAVGVKIPLVSEQMLPEIALLCPEVTCSVPAKITVDTGLDVFTHAAEAYVSPRATDFSDALAEKAATLVVRYLPRAVRDGNDLEARERLQNASCMAGMAFDNAGLGLCHSMAHALGANLHLSHGNSNALLLPHVIAFNAAEELPGRRYAALAKLLGCCCHNTETAVNGLIGLVRELMRETGVAPRLEQSLQKQAADALERMTTAALADRCLADNPRAADAAQVRALYQKLQ